MPRPFRPSIRSSRCWESDSFSAAVGSSRMSSFTDLFSAFAISTSCCLPTPISLMGVSGSSAEAHPGQQFGGAGPGLGPVDHAALGGLVAEEDVLHDGQLGDQREFLVDDHDAGVLAGPDVLELLDLVLVHDVAGVGAEGVDPGEDLHQGGLAGAVFTADGVDLAGLHPQVHLGQGFNAGEFLGDGAHLENYRIAVRVEGRHLPLRLQCVTSLSAPANRRVV